MYALHSYSIYIRTKLISHSQCEVIKKDAVFNCKLCGSSETVGQEVFMGSGRECRIQCMRLNNQRIENDQGFIDIMPQDIMNESYRSDFDSSFLSNRSKSISPLSRHTRDEDPNASSSFGSGNSSQSSDCGGSPADRDTKRKLYTAVTSPKDDMREHKRPRSANPFTTIQEPQNNIFNAAQTQLSNTSQEKVMPKFIPNHRFDKNIQAQWKYQHLMNAENNSLITKFKDSTNSFKPSTTTTSLWNAFVDSEMME